MESVKFINKDNLRIARDNAGMDTLSATKQISKRDVDIVAEWENGDALPTWKQVSKLAKIFNISELLFFSNELLKRNKVVPDYRVGASPENALKVNKLINLVISRQKTLERILKEDGLTKNKIQGSGINCKTPKELANFIKEKLSVNHQDIKSFSGVNARKEVLNYLITRTENQSVFVGKTISFISLNVEDMRGLYISNEYCPFIVLNRRDAVSAQIFTFVHELAHLFRKSDGISNNIDFRISNQNLDKEESFCNKVASEFLLPSEDFLKTYYEKTDIDLISDTYKVSKIFVFYRLKELGKIRREIQAELEQVIQKETARNLLLKAENEKKKEGGNYINSMKDSNGSLFNRVVSSSYLENRIGFVEATNLLRFSVENV